MTSQWARSCIYQLLPLTSCSFLWVILIFPNEAFSFLKKIIFQVSATDPRLLLTGMGSLSQKSFSLTLESHRTEWGSSHLDYNLTLTSSVLFPNQAQYNSPLLSKEQKSPEINCTADLIHFLLKSLGFACSLNHFRSQAFCL